MITNYTDLQSTIASWLAQTTNTVFTGDVPTMIQLAEQRMYDDLRAREMITRAAPASLTTEFANLPTDFLETQTVALVQTDTLGKKTETPSAYLEEDELLRTRQDARLGTPKNVAQYYTIYGTQIQFEAVPTGSESPPLEFRITYWAEFPVLSTGSPTNDIITNYPHVYFWATLMQAEEWLKNDPRIAVWEKNYVQAYENVNRRAQRRRGTTSTGAPY